VSDVYLYGRAPARGEEVLHQFDWCVDCLYCIGTPQIAKANREEPVDDPVADAR
jgi:hypothetical protein